MTLRYSKQKIEAALQLLAEFQAASFPHTDSTKAIEDLAALLQETSKNINTTPSSSLTAQTEMEATGLIAQILELLGVISNSANVRNSFEIHGPVHDLVSRLLGDDKVKFIVSFEWNYIPYTYPQTHPCLPSFVIIGLPASEASNALVLPVIGHELGHSLWNKENFLSQFEANVTNSIIDQIKGPYRPRYNAIFNRFGINADQCDDYKNVGTWSDAADYAFRQIEEIFSDFAGLFIFGGGYLDSFEYLLSPALSPERTPYYPPDLLRAEYLRDYAAKIGVAVEADFQSRFERQVSPFRSDSNAQLQMDLADVASSALIYTIADRVFNTCKHRGILPPSDIETGAVLEMFLMGVPAEQTAGFGAILNAGWSAFKSPIFMAGANDQSRMAAINELVLKSVEVFEIERMTERGPKKKPDKARA
ncbi:hypothetical protein [Mesorhizobium sp.]|uniref:hypothetical protein n=1 Tax=Mesorhizobium sp. TaxID=1871066 RepID=UPI000FE7D33A|nr:hypothetical protein [Mesorhizobium sp.]RWM32443.1 MAG: hypothetical protein EOR75_29155 [Mesorhizobium sp.]TJV48223.1 MAG: hypothetical protein E5Y01_29415 [Mesorhizobium sp.]